jgi:hypothetical protein
MKLFCKILTLLLFTSISIAQKPKVKSNNKILKYKAILVVGNSEDNTTSAIQSMNKIAEYLKENGIKTVCFYDKAAKWDDIKKETNGAHFFIYNGHGSPGGGLNIESGGSTKDILELKLSKNAVVCFQSVCFGAGSSASDENEISFDEAVKRVKWYAEPFIKSGAGCYYANNWDNGVLGFLTGLFNGKSSKTCFEYYNSEKIISFDKNKQIGLSLSNLGGTSKKTSYINGVKTVKIVPSHKSYDVAWVSNPEFTLKNIGK